MLTSFKHFRRSFSKRASGFTLVELIVVSAIILVISLFILFQQAKFNSSTLLRSLTYSVALSVRQAQVYGTSVRGFSSGGTVAFGSGYGVYLSTSITCPSGPQGTCYYMYADSAGGDGQRASNGSEDVVPPSPYRLGNGYVISKLCTRIGSGVVDCTASELSIFFRRPNPEACVATDVSPTACGAGVVPIYSAAYVEIKSVGNNDTRSIKITDTGQIAVCMPNLADLAQC